MRISPTQSVKLLKSRGAGALIGGLLLVIGLGAFVYAAKVRLDERGARNWVPHVAQIESARLTTHESDDGKTSYIVDVSYLYEWDEVTFKGKRYRLHDHADGNLKDKTKDVDALLLSKKDEGLYPIFVNPNNPRQSAIENEVHPSAKSSSLFLGFLFSILGFFTAFGPKVFR